MYVEGEQSNTTNEIGSLIPKRVDQMLSVRKKENIVLKFLIFGCELSDDVLSICTSFGAGLTPNTPPDYATDSNVTHAPSVITFKYVNFNSKKQPVNLSFDL